MYTKNVEIVNNTGLHARPAHNFVKLAKDFKSDITIKKGEKTANAKSILNILGLCISKGTKIELLAEGVDEKEAVETLTKYISEITD